MAEIVEPAVEPCETFVSIGAGRLGDSERATFCRCGWESADHRAAVWCDYCESEAHQTAACPFPDHDAYDAAVCPWTDAEECAMAAERSVAGTDGVIPGCEVHGR